ncbi:MAG: hypothetical protein ACWGQW_00620 [bacterium]
MGNNDAQIQAAVQAMIDTRDAMDDPDQNLDPFYEHVVSWEGGEVVILEKAIRNFNSSPAALKGRLLSTIRNGRAVELPRRESTTS